jgi:hypothetical protein
VGSTFHNKQVLLEDGVQFDHVKKEQESPQSRGVVDEITTEDASTEAFVYH